MVSKSHPTNSKGKFQTSGSIMLFLYYTKQELVIWKTCTNIKDIRERTRNVLWTTVPHQRFELVLFSLPRLHIWGMPPSSVMLNTWHCGWKKKKNQNPKNQNPTRSRLPSPHTSQISYCQVCPLWICSAFCPKKADTKCQIRILTFKILSHGYHFTFLLFFPANLSHFV